MPLHVAFTAYALIPLLALTGSPPVRAQAGDRIDDLERLTPAALVAAVEANNARLKEQAAAAEAAAWRIEPAAALADPMLMYGGPPNTVGNEGAFRNNVQLQQALPWPGTRPRKRVVAEQQASAAAEELGITRLDLVAAAKTAHAEWYYLHKAIEINESSQTLLAELARATEGRYAAGRALQQDVLQVEVEQVLLQEQRRALEQERRSLRARVNALLDRAPGAVLPPPAELPDPAALPDLGEVRAAANGDHPQIRHHRHHVAIANAQAELAEIAFFPSFEVSLGYNEMWAERDMRLMLGVTINVPFQRGRRRADLEAARADIRRSEHALADETAALLAAVESAYARGEQAIDVIRLYEERLLALVDQNVAAAVADYRSGAGLFLSVVTAERQRLTTRHSYERARADYWRAHAELEQAMGRPSAGEQR